MRLTIRRTFVGYVDRLRGYRVEVDGEEIGRVENGGTFHADLPPGRHRVRLAIDWCGSPTIDLDGSGDVDLTCRAAATPFTVLPRAIMTPNRYIALDLTR